ncbi:MAG: hypothetical protein ACT4P6_12120 [Gemmatimonadaceae bacterium]
MATQADVRRIALSLPGAEEEADRFAFSVANKGKLKGFVWVWLERIAPKKPRVPNASVIAVNPPNELVSATTRYLVIVLTLSVLSVAVFGQTALPAGIHSAGRSRNDAVSHFVPSDGGRAAQDSVLRPM